MEQRATASQLTDTFCPTMMKVWTCGWKTGQAFTVVADPARAVAIALARARIADSVTGLGRKKK